MDKYTFKIIPATKEDIPVIYNLIIALSEYEKIDPPIGGTVEDLLQFSFGEDKIAHIYCGWLIPNSGDDKPLIAGYTMHYLNYSFFHLRPSIHLEDLFVKDEYRGKGYGKKLLIHVAQIAKEKNYQRVEWDVLAWNAPSIKFYESLGATPHDAKEERKGDFITYKLEKEAIDKCTQ